MEIVENDFNVIKDNISLLSVEEVSADVYDSTLSVTAKEFSYMEILNYD